MMFGRNARAGVFHADFYAVRAWQAKPPALLQRRHGGDAALPEMGRRPQHHCAAARSVLQGIVEQIRGNLRSEEHTSELQSRLHLVCRLLLEKKKKTDTQLF